MEKLIEKIEKELGELTSLREEISKKPLTEQLFLTRELNTIQSKIEVLEKILSWK